jgi:putative transposase
VLSNREKENNGYTKMIAQIHKESKERYGAPKIHQTLLQQGVTISLKRVQRLMKKAEIRSITYKKFRPYGKKLLLNNVQIY